MGCTNSKERPRTPPPDAALQSAVSDGDGFWAANGETTETAAQPSPSPTKPPAIKPVMPGGRKKSKNNKKKKRGNKKK